MREPLYDKKALKKRGLVTNGYSLPYNPNLIARAADMRNNMTPAENKLWIGFLENFVFKVYSQRPIDNFIVDFYCSRLKLIIEIDGSVHDSLEAKVSDEERTKILESYDLKVIRFNNSEVEDNFTDVCRKISDYSNRPSPLKGNHHAPKF